MRLLVALALAASPAWASDPFPISIGGAFELVDQYGTVRTEADPDGRHQLLFFGYARCPSICTAAMPMMADLTDALAAEGKDVLPVMVTVAPEQDSPEVMQEELSKLHAEFVGLTGSEAQLTQAYKAFSISREPLFEDPEYGWIYAHSSFIHLLDAEGQVKALIPPILDLDAALKIARNNL